MYLESGKYTNNKAVYLIPGKNPVAFSAIVYRENISTKRNNFIISNHVGDKLYFTMDEMRKVLGELKVIQLLCVEAPTTLKNNFQVSSSSSISIYKHRIIITEEEGSKEYISLTLSQHHREIFLATAIATKHNPYSKLLTSIHSLVQWLEKCIGNNDSDGEIKTYNVDSPTSALTGIRLKLVSVNGRGSNLLVIGDTIKGLLSITSTGFAQRCFAMLADNETLERIIHALNEFLSSEQQYEELSFTSNFGDKNGYLVIEKSPGTHPISFKFNCDQKLHTSAVTKVCTVETLVALRDSLVSVLSVRNQE